MPDRVLPVMRSPVERVRDWNEFHAHVDESTLRDQGARCMNCGVPFCHTGEMINGAASGCPLNNLIPDWNDLVFRGNWKAALDLLHKTNNFPEFTGRVCPAPCEGSCVRGLVDEPVQIRTIECAIVERGFGEGWIVPRPPRHRTGRKVAVIGSGPAGLACAAELNRAGHLVSVFEKADRVGGLLMYGIPNMKLDKAIVQRRVDLLAAEGVRFVTNTDVGRDYPADRLLEEFDAVVLCGGASRPRDLSVENRNLPGVHFAMDFLRANTKSLLDDGETTDFISAKDKHVIVIGGGDTGTDCVATALRHGCRSLVQFEILPRQPFERAAGNPWPQWPRIHRVDYGHEEAIAVNGSDPRCYSVMTQRFIGEGAVEAVETVEIDSSFNEVSGPKRVWPAQLVLLAMGFLGPEKDGLISQLGLTLNAKGLVAVDPNKMTNIPGIFAAGDIERGQSLVVWAIADGRKAARHVDQYLTSSTSQLRGVARAAFNSSR
ncbi:MAG TPA: glutamate synthase subunit beta [Pyrinomonadaceae bacterium]|nr:glutamate synthase subunit beta [Pyrinomonadaceae bacterium]